jgi:hypothetical protein
VIDEEANIWYGRLVLLAVGLNLALLLAGLCGQVIRPRVTYSAPELQTCSQEYGMSDAPAISASSVRVTFYTLTGIVRYGEPGDATTRMCVAACSTNFPAHSILRFNDGFVVECRDTGLLGSTGWIDIWAPSYAWGLAEVERVYGQRTTVEVLRWGR